MSNSYWWNHNKKNDVNNAFSNLTIDNNVSKEYVDSKLATKQNIINESNKLDVSLVNGAVTSSAIFDMETQTHASNTYATQESLSNKQDLLLSGINIKTINNESILGSGNINIQGGSGTIYVNDSLPEPNESFVNKYILVSGNTYIDPDNKRTGYHNNIHNCGWFEAEIAEISVTENDILGNITVETVSNLLQNRRLISETDYQHYLGYISSIEITYDPVAEYNWHCRWRLRDDPLSGAAHLTDTELTDSGIEILRIPSEGEIVPTVIITITSRPAEYRWYHINTNLEATITLNSNYWDGSNNQIVNCNNVGITKDSKLYITPETDSAREYIDCGIACVDKNTNQLTFNCTTLPQHNLKINIMIS